MSTGLVKFISSVVLLFAQFYFWFWIGDHMTAGDWCCFPTIMTGVSSVAVNFFCVIYLVDGAIGDY